MPAGQKHIRGYMKHLQKNKTKIQGIYAIAASLLIVSALLGILLGATRMSLSDLIKAIIDTEGKLPESKILWYVRFPRVMASLLLSLIHISEPTRPY